MPLLDFDQKETWDSLYSCVIDGVTYHFEKAGKQEYFGNDHWALLKAINPSKDQKIIIIGAAFGWVAEDWINSGYTVLAVDTSTWIHQNKASNSLIDVLNADCLTSDGRNLIGTGDIVISEDVFPCLSDQECVNLSSAMHLIAPRVYHWVSTGSGYLNLNWKTREEWKALLPNDSFIERGTSVVM
jgi:hypothetical protein